MGVVVSRAVCLIELCAQTQPTEENSKYSTEIPGNLHYKLWRTIRDTCFGYNIFVLEKD